MNEEQKNANVISDEELKKTFQLNMENMVRLININPIDKDEVRKLLVANLDLYKIAKERGVSLYGFSFLPVVASAIDYNIDEVHSILNVGAYRGIHMPNSQSNLTKKR